MMVEAGGTESVVGALRGRRPEGRRGASPRASKQSKTLDHASPSSSSSSSSRRPDGTRPDRSTYIARRPTTAPRSTTPSRPRRRRPRRRRQQIADKAERTAPPRARPGDDRRRAAAAAFDDSGPTPRSRSRRAFRSLTKKVVRTRIVNEGVRIDGRGPPTSGRCRAEVGVLPTAHGSGLFQRGETQVLNVTTLGMPRMEQMLDTHRHRRPQALHAPLQLPAVLHRRDRLHAVRPKRREIGHGALAERALVPVRARRSTSGRTRCASSPTCSSSNGSTSMASVCGSTLSLMDAGVPIKAPVAGIAMGLVFAEGKYTTLTDILGAEDAFGDMDFKVAGTAEFVTALQLDTKIDGIPADVLGAGAATRRKDARLQDPRGHERRDRRAARRRARHRAEDRQLRDPDRQDRRGHRAQGQGHQHDPAGDRRRHLASTTTAWSARVASARPTAMRSPRPSAGSSSILDPPTAEVGAVYKGRVVNITKFGAFVNILPGRDGLRPHLEARSAASASTGSRTCVDARRRDRGAGRRHRPERQDVRSTRR